MKKIISLSVLTLWVLIRFGDAVIAPLSLPYIIDTSNTPEVRWVDANDSTIKAKVNEIKDTVNTYLNGGLVISSLSSTGNLKALIDNDANETGKFFWIAHNSTDTLAKFSDDSLAHFFKHGQFDSNLTLGGQLKLSTTTGILNFRSGSTAKWGMGRHSGGNLYIYDNSGAGEDAKVRFNNTFGGSGGIVLDISQESLYVGNKVASAQLVANGAGISISNSAATNRVLSWQTSGVTRWQATADNVAESGANAGSNWYLKAFSDAGSAIGNAISIARSSLAVTFGGRATFLDSIIGTSQRLAGDLHSAGVITTGDITSNGNIMADTVKTPVLQANSISVVNDISATSLNISGAAHVTGRFSVTDSIVGSNGKFSGNLEAADTVKGGSLVATGKVIADSIISPKFYEEGSGLLFTTGFAPDVSRTYEYVRIGKVVCLKLEGVNQTSASHTMSYTGLPTKLRPASTQYLPIEYMFNGDNELSGLIRIQDSTLTFIGRTSDTTVNFSPFNDVGAKGWAGGTITYSLQ